MRLSPRLSLFLTVVWTLVLFGGLALLSEMTSEAAPLTYDPDLEFRVVAHVPVGDAPHGIALVGDNVYVANHDDHTLSIIDANTLTVTQVISAGLEPCAMAYNPNNGYLYVTNRHTLGTVTIIDTSTNMTVTVRGVGDRPTGIAFNPNDGVMYVPLFGESEVAVISGTDVLPGPISGFGSNRELSHVAVNADTNMVYVTDHASDSKVFVIDGATRTYSATIDLTAGQGPWGIAVNPVTNKIYVATIDASRLVIIDGNDLTAPLVYTNTGEYNLRMVAVDPVQNLVFVTEDETETPPDPDGDPEHVFVFDAETGNWVGEFGMDVGQDPEQGIAFDPVRHRLYVSNRRSNTVTVVQTVRKVYLPLIMKAGAEDTNELDIAIVFDKSGSMEFDTLCYGCWVPISGQRYPTGTRTYLGFPYDYTAYDPDSGPWPPPGGICSDTVYYFEDSYQYIVIEAEHYSDNHSIWDRDYAVQGLAHWTLQRNTQAYSHDYSGPVNSSSLDSYGGYMKATPYYYSTYAEGAVAYSGIEATTPRLDYDFHTPTGTGGGSGSYYIWLRAQGGRWQSGFDVDPRVVHWGLDGSPQGSETVANYGIAYDGARGDHWSWNSIGPVTLSGGTDYTLNLWVGGLGFAVDKIIITRDSNCTASGQACGQNSWQGPDQTQGRTREACDPCDPRYGLHIPGQCDHTGDDLWDDEQFIRAAKEAVKRFVERLNPELDQVSYVHYSSPNTTDTAVGSHLYCQKRLGDSCQNYDEVLEAIEATQAGGNTSMGDGMRLGIYTLRTDFTLAQCQTGDYPCGRPGAAPIMIVMTDGVANDYMSPHYDNARDSYGPVAFDALWPGGAAQDYVIYQAIQAHDNGIIVYTISLSVEADFELMEEVAERTGGEHYFAPDADALDHIVDDILRLIS